MKGKTKHSTNTQSRRFRLLAERHSTHLEVKKQVNKVLLQVLTAFITDDNNPKCITPKDVCVTNVTTQRPCRSTFPVESTNAISLPVPGNGNATLKCHNCEDNALSAVVRQATVTLLAAARRTSPAVTEYFSRQTLLNTGCKIEQNIELWLCIDVKFDALVELDAQVIRRCRPGVKFTVASISQGTRSSISKSGKLCRSSALYTGSLAVIC